MTHKLPEADAPPAATIDFGQLIAPDKPVANGARLF